MIYKDKTFCYLSKTCDTKQCLFKITESMLAEAEEQGALISYGYINCGYRADKEAVVTLSDYSTEKEKPVIRNYSKAVIEKTEAKESALAQAILARRSKVGLTQFELGSKCGVTPACICRYETGRLVPDRAIYNKLNSAVGLENKETKESIVQEILRKCSGMSAYQLAKLSCKADVVIRKG